MKLGAVLLARVQQSDGQLKMRPVILEREMNRR
jgi:hypothetical protein